MIEDIVNIRLCKPEDVKELVELAEADGHCVIAPTHVVRKHKRIVGCIGVVPSVLLWLDTERVLIRDSVAVMQFYENLLAAQGAEVIGVPCVDKSPLRQYMTRVGYVESKATTLYLKNLNHQE